MHYPGSYLDAGRNNRKVRTVANSYNTGNGVRKWEIIEIGTATDGNTIVALESLYHTSSYLDAGGNRKVWTAEKPYTANNFRKWKIIELGNDIIALESMKFPNSYLDAGGNRRVWTAEKPYTTNNFRKWKIIDLSDSSPAPTPAPTTPPSGRVSTYFIP